MQLQPPSETEQEVLTLEVSPPVQAVPEEKAGGMVPAVEKGRELEIGNQAKGFVVELSKLNPNSPEFVEKLTDIQNLAQAEIVQTGLGTSRLLERKAGSNDATTRVTSSLTDLRSTVAELTPNAADLTGPKKILGFIPGGKRIRRYFHKYETAQQQLDNIVKSLLAGQDEIMKDNAAIQQEKVALWEAMGALNEYIVLAEKLDGELVSEIERLRQAGNVEAANTMDSDMLFAVRQRRQDLMTQLAVSVQGYMVLELTRKNNVELIKGVDRARTTTIYALRTAVIAAQALDTQALVLDQIDAVNEVTNKTIEQTALMLRQQTARIHEQATNSGVAVETLTKAFDNIYATMDEIDAFKQKANATMATTIDALSTQLERAKPQLERAKALEASENKAINS